MTKKLLLSICLLFTSVAFTQNVNIPDVNFKNALLANAAINDDLNTEISLWEASSYNGVLDVSNLGITDLTGIEAFTGTIYLNCGGNLLTTLDLSANTGLTNILHLDNNLLTSVIFPATCNVTLLHINNNPMTSIDVSSLQTMTNLYAMNCYNLTSLTIGNNPTLNSVNISQTAMTTIDLTGATGLESFLATYSNLTGVLDLSPYSSLVFLDCQYSDYITEINMQNGNNMNVPPGWFSATDCPALNCVQVDNVPFANAVWSSDVDPGVVFSLDCSSSSSLASSITIQGQGGVSAITTAGGTLQMEATVLPSTASQSVMWGIVTGSSYATIDASGVLTATNNGTVTVGAMTTDGTNLSASTDIVITGQLSSVEENVANTFSISPNPASNYIEIKTDVQVELISIFNANGQLILTTTEQIIPVNELPSGVYYVVLSSADNTWQSRFIKN